MKNLEKQFGAGIYTEENVMLSGTHTHSTPGGFLRDLLFDIPIFGFVKETYNAYVKGITRVSSLIFTNIKSININFVYCVYKIYI